MATAWITAFAATALVLQALLLSLTPPAAQAVAAIGDISAYALCFGSGARREDPAAPAPPHDHSDHACCILCAVPGLAGGTAPIAIALPAWDAPLAAPLQRAARSHLRRPPERAPVRARAPPA
ncbi:MAG: hypothetical protein R3D62_21245 [Xanthobacteraceae bacterium]